MEVCVIVAGGSRSAGSASREAMGGCEFGIDFEAANAERSGRVSCRSLFEGPGQIARLTASSLGAGKSPGTLSDEGAHLGRVGGNGANARVGGRRRDVTRSCERESGTYTRQLGRFSS